MAGRKDAPSQVYAALRLLRQDAEGPQHRSDVLYLPADLLLGPDNPLSRARVSLWLAVRDQGGFDSLHALAAALQRDKTRVSRDVSLLERFGLVKTVRSGRNRAVRSAAQAIEIV